ncbi:hypothetical protein T265_02050 [Opisthorchis viverrini]|uniref:Uncharacterized protein n=1 Tax=Opisthorchis viverrini TaxID=6198 RepID=A0A074ZWI5_OPIVI|nr:hypothetical protein T265_02050 [Opisthorchis viverrini]KER31823.1 hypothetical protein T265_02050 [Opisthorchis viverrini]
MSNSALNWVPEGACTTVGGRSFHAATTRSEKKFCLMNVSSEATILQGKHVKHQGKSFLVYGFNAGRYFLHGSLNTINVGYVLTSWVENWVGKVRKSV